MEMLTESTNKYDLDQLSSISEDSKKIMLFIDDAVPQRDKAAGHFIVFEYLKIFRKNGFKIIFWPHSREKTEPYTEELQQMGIEVIYGDVSFQDFIEKYGGYIDISIISRPEIAARYLDLVSSFSKGKILYFAHDLHFLRQSRMAEVMFNKEETEEALKTKEYELGIMKRVDLSLFLNKNEIEVVEKEDPGITTAAIPWIQKLNIKGKMGFNERDGVVYLGGFLHAPNGDAVKWFHECVFPIIKKKITDVKVFIVGSNIPQEIKELDSEYFKVLGFVENLDEVFNKTRVFIAPLRFGAGIKGKIAMAQSYGLPVVTTNIGAEGMELVDGESALIADEAEEFAEKVIEVYQNKELWEKVSSNSIDRASEKYSVGVADQVIMGIIDNLERQKKLELLETLVGQKNEEIERLQEEITRIHNSTSWKISRPVRMIRPTVHKFINIAQRLFSWTDNK